MNQVGVDNSAVQEPDPLERRWDLYPVSVRGPDAFRERMARVAVGDRRMRIWTVARGTRDAAVVVETELVGFDETRSRREWTLTDADGGEWAIVRGAGCGCGHPLRKVDPWAE